MVRYPIADIIEGDNTMKDEYKINLKLTFDERIELKQAIESHLNEKFASNIVSSLYEKFLIAEDKAITKYYKELEI